MAPYFCCCTLPRRRREVNTSRKAPWLTRYLLLLCSHCHLSTFCHSAHSVPPPCAEFLSADVRPVLVNSAVLLSPIGNNMFHSCIPRQRFRDGSPAARWRHFPKRWNICSAWASYSPGAFRLSRFNLSVGRGVVGENSIWLFGTERDKPLVSFYWFQHFLQALHVSNGIQTRIGLSLRGKKGSFCCWVQSLYHYTPILDQYVYQHKYHLVLSR